MLCKLARKVVTAITVAFVSTFIRTSRRTPMFSAIQPLRPTMPFGSPKVHR
jgi:hypothetical protein